MTTFRVNSTRIWDTLHESCQWGATPDGGMNRVTLNDDDKRVREWFILEGKKLGCQIKIDQMGTIFLIRAGEDNSIAPIAIGSHLDTQPSGGRYDGIVGVHTGLEILRTFHENNYVTYAPICVVNWTNEEGARFPKTMVSSGVWSGQISLEDAYNVEDINNPGLFFGKELEKIGYKGEVPASYKDNPLSAHFEVHIEQGTRLETAGLDIGIVSGVKGIRWFEIEIFGTEGHTGTTPMEGRKDALAASSEMILCVEETAKKHGGLGTVGVIHPLPQSPNTIPGYSKFSVDCRHDSNADLVRYTEELLENLEAISRKRQVKYTIKETWHFKQLEFDSDCKAAIQESAEENGLTFTSLYSGIGHDSCYTATRVPTAMIFIPCKNGISHSPKEYSSPKAVADGAQAMLGAVIRYDQRLRELGK
ncbi:putative beta-alanine synthase [Sugiyamaella lignohabitans]|uniref:Putative beta-alanine synthase n=1 Tax=Sugiyamaella lignohabitans TaxID=796027 RepID=A0A167FHX7_9ASCO|nr:putative beta-alanine synthase [Sugiyamaella lignohabitans]ANB15319.1 putative beta-alanine synthase [Sugiyamaella lignohabitans]